jgi:hypothetical protein
VTFDIAKLDARALATMAEHYEEHGFCVLTGLQEVVTDRFLEVLAAITGSRNGDLAQILDPTKPGEVFDRDLRKKLSRVDTPAEFASSLLRVLEPVLMRLVGPFVHVSSTFHAQFKGYPVKAVDHGGYVENQDYMEVHGPYLLHQDFTGASMPTSPSAMTLWVGLNSCQDWNLRLYPGSHRLGLLCAQWLSLEDPRLSALNRPVDIAAQPGSAVVFNSLILHGTSNAGASRRVSCDIRFFPLCGFLPSQAHILGETPCTALRDNLKSAPGPVIQGPLLEDRIFLGDDVDLHDVPPASVLNWVNYVKYVVRGEMDQALPHLDRFVNKEIGVDPLEVFAAKFHGHPVCEATLRSLHQRLCIVEPSAAEGVRLERLISRISRTHSSPVPVGKA